ncbi:hypothetical protein MIB92_05850 [Aestuariirhabdus sp. Z084]|uniref:hypothetical protein n=1 Tax=Aestuariirhabdus haliotis TaxID=2918751 RepID=UPI00201B35F1|nr:hypothetical protein [Aestuariirhabdus haliotis]MCL6415167.1 hypothetical protein [Aestuariirhabdus haliotis]MCL6420042.1 hypothetical protein [Aestuariirhabdus haliotis]
MNLLKLLPLIFVSFSSFASEQAKIDLYYGTYGDSYKKLIVYPANQDSAVIFVSIDGGPPNYSGSSLFGKATLKNGKLFHSTFRSSNDINLCEFSISLEGDKAITTLLTSDFQCGFFRYSLEGSFNRISKTPEGVVKNIFTEETCSLESIAEQLRITNEVSVHSHHDCMKL